MKKRKLRNLGLLFVVLLTGCGDSPKTVFRSALNGKNEFIDALMKVVDEESANRFDVTVKKQYRERLTDLRDKLDKWAIAQSWTWQTWDPNNPGRVEKSAADLKKEYKENVMAAIEDTKAYVAQEEKNLSRIRHEVERLSNRLQQLENEKGGNYPKLTMLANEGYHASLRIK